MPLFFYSATPEGPLSVEKDTGLEHIKMQKVLEKNFQFH